MASFKRKLKEQLPAVFFTLAYIRFYLQKLLYKPRLGPQEKQYLKALNKHGYCVIEQYYSLEQCQKLIQNIKQFMQEHSDYVQHKDDERLFGIEHCGGEIKAFNEDASFQKIASAVNCKASKAAFTLAGMLNSDKKGSSGGGWHRDAFVSQFKAMLYLTDVSEKNGPFQMLEGSHRLISVLQDSFAAKLKCMQDRISDTEAEALICRNPVRLKAFTGKAGTVILFNSSSIHRGSPIIEGTRVALTNYYYETDKINSEMFKSFVVYPYFPVTK
jgi:ectoine hydroxylase-related dioxygenase (phytanoyl-CoA dioxygenase family)